MAYRSFVRREIFPYRPTRDVSLLSGHASYLSTLSIANIIAYVADKRYLRLGHCCSYTEKGKPSPSASLSTTNSQWMACV